LGTSNKLYLSGLRKKTGTDDAVPALIESEVSSKEFRKSWARLIQKIYPVKFPKGNPIEQGK
jgi:RNase adaptor protein for sRNA GlmZ degradation